ncbi:DUF3072 domain-containing protein [Vallicoccus soli]|uniref:DUF3072 domain-containing protein n=1 Tax=Vallicoccus soli TaxID=2339232 RepID=A0A3A3Z2H0_9ACTN|nr:DUF3072 domain-containing protein [Vallicoccus soli]
MGRAPAEHAPGRRGRPHPGGPVSEPSTPADERPAGAEQLAELRELAAAAGEEVPEGVRAAEADQRITELRALLGR